MNVEQECIQVDSCSMYSSLTCYSGTFIINRPYVLKKEETYRIIKRKSSLTQSWPGTSYFNSRSTTLPSNRPATVCTWAAMGWTESAWPIVDQRFHLRVQPPNPDLSLQKNQNIPKWQAAIVRSIRCTIWEELQVALRTCSNSLRWVPEIVHSGCCFQLWPLVHISDYIEYYW